MRKEGGKPTAPRDRESSSRPGRHCLQGVSRLGQERRYWRCVVPATALPHGRENGSKAEGVEDLKGVAGFVGQ